VGTFRRGQARQVVFVEFGLIPVLTGQWTGVGAPSDLFVL
jgi:hypothetical protein